jgi:hypothetical protein
MARTDPAPLRELRDWLSQSVAEAEALMPELLDLPVPRLHLRLSTRPALRTVGVMQCLLDLAEKALGRFRRHAYELTAIAVEIVEDVVLPPQEQEIAWRLRAIRRSGSSTCSTTMRCTCCTSTSTTSWRRSVVSRK